MPYPFLNSQRAFPALILAFSITPVLAATSPRPLQTPADKQANGSSATPPVIKEQSSPKAAAYYHFSLGHVYEELAESSGNRSDYVNKAIENFRLAMQEDPSASFLIEDIAELYRISGRVREAVEEAQKALKANPDDLNARRVLARVYTEEIGDAQTNHIDEGMARRAVEQYKLITEKDPKDVDSLIMLGRLNKLLGNSVDAEGAFKKALAADPQNEDATVGLADVYSDRGDSHAASDLLEKLARTNPSPRALMGLAASYEQLHQYKDAAEAYKKALALDPTRMELKAALARDQALAGEPEEALKTYRELAQANPQDPQAYLGMFSIYRAQKKFDLAEKMIEKAKQLDAEDPEIIYNQALLLEDEGKTAEAIATLKNTLTATSRRSYDATQRAYRLQMLDTLGLLYQKNEQYEQSVDAFRQIAALDVDAAPRAEAQIVDTYRQAKQYAKAEQEYDAASKNYPNDRTLREVHAQLLSDEGKTDAAVADLKQLLNGKNDREIYISIAEVYEKAHKYPEMAPPLDEAEKLAHSNDERARVLFTRGAMYEREKKYDLAEKQFREVLAMDSANDPIYAEALNYLGYMFADQNVRLEEAKNLIQRAISLDPNNYAYLDSLGWLYYRLDRLDEAEQQLTRSVQLMSKDPTIHDHLGDVYFKRGKIKEAIAQWQFSLQEWNNGATADVEPGEMAKVQKKLDTARLRLAKMQTPNRPN